MAKELSILIQSVTVSLLRLFRELCVPAEITQVRIRPSKSEFVVTRREFGNALLADMDSLAIRLFGLFVLLARFQVLGKCAIDLRQLPEIEVAIWFFGKEIDIECDRLPVVLR